MRIIKQPDVRRQEILNAAIRVFAHKGYDAASIADIAKEAGISQGLCYRYFPGKESLCDAAVDLYARQIAAGMTDGAQPPSLREQIAARCGRFDLLSALESEGSALHTLFHRENKLHDLLALRVAQEMVPRVADTLRRASADGEIAARDPDMLAYLLVFGQLGLFLSGEAAAPERIQRCMTDLLFPQSKEDMP